MTKKELLKVLIKAPDETIIRVMICSPNEITSETVKTIKFSTDLKTTRKGFQPVLVATLLGEEQE
jgi:hypothetical protein